MVVAVALRLVGGKRGTARIVDPQLRAAPILQQAEVSREVARRIPVRYRGLQGAARADEIAILKARHPLAMLYFRRADARHEHAGPLRCIGSERSRIRRAFLIVSKRLIFAARGLGLRPGWRRSGRGVLGGSLL